MAKINYDYYIGNDIYNDGEVEEKLLKYYRGEIKDLEWTNDTIFYLTTNLRENILNWYPFKRTDEVLEIGSGCGTLTDLLCRKCNRVYSIEGSKRRAEITYERNKKYNNLMVYAAHFGTFPLDTQFDYVILVGVFEYAKRFFGKNIDPVRTFLEEIKKVLKPTGKILMAIENRYGVKYWAGANEDHIPRPYVGFYDYDKYDVQTFGMGELKQLFTETKLENYKFYYPFPDYKLPEVIYTDERLPDDEELRMLPIYLYGGEAKFDIRGTLHGLRDNRQFGFFANSFLIECGGDKSSLANIAYAKVASSRTDRYRLITIQQTDSILKKIVGSEQSYNHLGTIMDNHKRIANKGINIVSTEMSIDEEELIIEYCSGKKYISILKQTLKNGSRIDFERKIDYLWDYYRSISIHDFFINPFCEDLKKIYPIPTDILKVSMIDGNVSNLLVDNRGKFILIDQEWVTDKQLPAEYLMFYSLLHICNIFRISTTPLFNKYNITEEKQRLFLDITQQYYSEIIDKKIEQKKAELNYQWKGDCEDEVFTQPVCYYNTGDGFNENQKRYGFYKKKENGWYVAYFQLPRNVLNVRIDPALCGEKCLYFTTLLINGRAAEFTGYNIVSWEGKKVLNLKNPFVILTSVETEFQMEIDLKVMTISEVEEYFKFLNSYSVEQIL